MAGLGTRRSRQRRWLLSGRVTYEQYIEQLLAAGGFWHPMRNTSGLISTNAAYRGGMGPELLVNGDAESWASSTDLNNFTEILTGSSTIHQETSDVHGGTSAIRYDLDGSNSAVGVAQALNVVIGDTYRLRVYAKSEPTARAMRLDLGSAVGGQQTLTDEYALYEQLAIAQNISQSFIPQRGNTGANYSLYFDDMSVVKIGERDGLIAGTTTLGQTGLRGPNEAFLFDGATSLITVTNVAALQGLTEFTLWMLFRPTSAGESNVGTMFSKAGEFTIRFLNDTLRATVSATGTASVISTTTVSFNQWHTLALSYSHSGDKLAHTYLDGVEVEYATNDPASGTRASNANPVIVGNIADASQTLAGLIDEALVIRRALSASELALLHTLATGMPPGVAV